MKLTTKQIERLNYIFNRLNDDNEELRMDLALALATWLDVHVDLIWRAYSKGR